MAPAPARLHRDPPRVDRAAARRRHRRATLARRGRRLPSPSRAPIASPAPARRRPGRRGAAAAPAAPARPPRRPPPPEPPATNRAGSYSLARQLGLGVRRIVIDAGHGGHDPGTIGRGGLQEKELVLDVALRLDAPRPAGARGRGGPHPLHGRLHPARGAHRHRELARRRPLPLDPRQREPQRPRARGIETYFLSFARTPTPRTWRPARTRSRPRPSRTCRTSSRRSPSTARSTRAATSPPRSRSAWSRGARSSTRSPTGASTPRRSTSSSAPTCRPSSPRSPSSPTPRTRSGSDPRVPRGAGPQPARGVKTYLEA